MPTHQSQALAKAITALTLMSTPARADGTYNRDRKACELLARETLSEIDRLLGRESSIASQASPRLTPAPQARPDSGVVDAPSGARNALVHLTAEPRRAQGSGPFTVYSDGASKGNPGRSGWGAAILSGAEFIWAEGGFIGEQTNQVAELMGALEALRRIPEGAKVLLISDSQYTLNGLMQWRKGWERNGWVTADKSPVKNKDIWVALCAEADKRIVETRWVRGHSGDPMNELCDELANEAVRLGAALMRH